MGGRVWGRVLLSDSQHLDAVTRQCANKHHQMMVGLLEISLVVWLLSPFSNSRGLFIQSLPLGRLNTLLVLPTK